MRLTLRQIVAFEAIARTGSVTRACAELSASQSALSASLRDLEDVLGVALFDRRGKRLILNDAGRRLQPRATSLLRQLREFESASADSTLRGSLVVGGSTTIGTYLLPGICGRFIAAHPEVRIELVVDSAAAVMDSVQGMSLDVGFIEAACSRPALQSEPWGGDSLVLFTAPDHPLADGRVHSIHDVGEAVWFLQPTGAMTRALVTTAVLQYLSAIPIGLVSQNLEALKRAVRASRAIGCLSRLAVQKELDAGVLRELRVKELAFVRKFCIITRKSVYQGDLQSSFIRFAGEAMRAGRLAAGGKAGEKAAGRRRSKATRRRAGGS
ncbi:MAG: LysR family transcriptional regulator, partial [Betaproteobacteria bacterium]|nr:LysR family transcriptional regulator [Betaproteobacteria bacterium]